MSKRGHCSQCGAPLLADVREAICPLCELRGALNLDDGDEPVVAPDRGPAGPQPSGSPRPSDFPSPVGPERVAEGRVREHGERREVRGEGQSSTSSIGDYELLEEIARGGMGVVFKARQRSLHRLVALKLLPTGTLAQPEAVKRFQAEASAAAALQHPNIVAIHEIGVQGDQHFIAMDLVEGPPLSRVIYDLRFTIDDFRRIARWMKAVAEAVHYAHERGILHRDLKPSNILLGPDDQPRVTDFGLAKRFNVGQASRLPSAKGALQSGPLAAGAGETPALLSSDDLTLSGQVLGSPNYMPPEQATAHRGEASRRSDVYGLGATLYHLLTGRAPFQGASITEVLQQVAHADPLAPRLLQAGVPADLETICLKCLEKEPAKRYPTARALADELNRFLHDEPIHARPVGRVEKAWRWCRRKPALAGLGLATFLLLVAGFTGLSLAGLRNAAVRTAQQREYFAGITLADNYVRIGDIQRALDVLTNCPPRFRNWEWGRLMYLCHQEIATLHTVTNLKVAIVGGIDYTRVIVNPDQSRLVTVGEDGAATAWELKTGAKLFSVGGSTNRIIDMAFAWDGRRLALLGSAGEVEMWDAAEARRLFGFVASNGPVRNVTFSSDGAQVKVTTADSASAWDSQTGRFASTTPPLPGKFPRLTLDPFGTRIATVDARRKVQLWDAETGKLRHTLDGRFSDEARLFFSPDGIKLLVADPSNAPSTVWNAETGEELASLNTRVDSAAFNVDGSRIATAGGDNVARVWSANSGREILPFKGHAAIVRFIAFSSDSERITTASEDGAVKTWRSELGREYIKSGPLSESLSFSPDGARLAVAQDDNLATVWDVETGQRLLNLEGHLHRVNKVAFSRDGKRLVTSSFDKTVRIWDAETGRLQQTLRGHSNLIYSVAISPDGRYVASCGDLVRVWDLVAGGTPRVLPGKSDRYFMSLDFSPDGKQLATGSGDASVVLWDHTTGERRQTLTEHTERVWSVAYSPDGRTLATAGFDKSIHLWDPRNGRRFRTLRGHFKIYAANFSPDGKRLITATAEHMQNFGQATAQIWDVETGRELIILEGHTASIGFAAFSPDGRRAASCDWNGVVRVWEAFPWQEQAYPGTSDQHLAERASLQARAYWHDRLGADSRRSSSTLNGFPKPGGRINRSEFPARGPGTPQQLIDLTEHYNALLNVSWIPKHYVHLLASDLSSLPTGVTPFANVPFDVRGLIQLRAPSNDWLELPGATHRLPERVDGIPVGRKFTRWHALMGTMGKEPDGTPIGGFVLHNTDGSQREVEIKYGQHVRDWWSGGDARDDIRDGSVVWRGETHLTRALAGEIRVFISTFQNPRPDVMVEQIDFVSKLTGSGPFLIALTIEP